MILDQIQADLKSAMIARDELKKVTLQGLKATLKYAEIEHGEALDDVAVEKVLQKEAKKRKEAAGLFRKGGNEESASKEEAELTIIESYLPEQASESEVEAAVEKAITDIGASSMQDMGKVMGVVKAELGNSVDGSLVARFMKEKLQ